MAQHTGPDMTLSSTAGAGMRVAVISARWNAEITDQLHERAIATATASGAKVEQWRVAGALELPVAVAAACKKFDAVIATGCVIEGETEHFRVVCDAVTYGLTRIALDHGTPVGNGVLTVSNQAQAIDRAGGPGAKEDKGADSAIAAIQAAQVLKEISEL
ncbi:MAG TPA: 6,7-dimethyl-8-ribityllumazine synthase [Candidatus Corynebacterium gallistercoris]|uniref:6,7-dimethyl-8-ribityllumazine synthase n=1 Tax=Candidatus Corynebacterium gallistercoris TaxID=2838530 RepID=A0A9D1S0Q4_9CORY|nr:6,7-dimethyl-8-ribityllumazine synthase [Candidatus Corynebacterium gallistercoris]